MFRRLVVMRLPRPRARALAIASCVALVTLAASLPLVRLRGQPFAVPLADRNTSTCTAGVTTTLRPVSPRLCDPVDITTTLQTACPVCPEGVSVVFIQDDTPYPDWQKKVSLQALDEFIRYSQLGQKVSVGVIHYSAAPRTVLRPTLNLAAARAPLTSFRVAHNPRAVFMEAAKAGVQMMRDSRRLHGNKVQRECEFIIYFVYTKIYMQDKGEEMIQAGRYILREVDNLYVGCPHQNPEECTIWEPRVPESERYYTEDPEPSKLRNMTRAGLTNIQTAGSISIRTLALDQWLPPDLRLVPDSFNVPPAQVVQDGGNTKLTWNWRMPKATTGMTLTFRAEPQEPAVVRSDVRSSWSDSENRRGELRVSSSPIEIQDDDCTTPTPVPTPTLLPTATQTLVPTATKTEVPTPTPSRTPTPRPRPIYLPMAVREECVPTTKHADVVLVIDLSTSMNRLTRAGRTKLAATLDAAHQFVSFMDLNGTGPGDQVAVVGFNRTAWIEAPLTGDEALVRRAIDALPARQQEYTRLDLALSVGAEALIKGPHRAGSSAVLILLTDGLPNQVPVAEDGRMETTVLRAAAAAKQAGITIYTIAIGAPTDTDPVLLKGCATDADHYYYTPDPEDLAAIYGAIAYRIGCPARSFWGKR